jgi:hypothetical protein
MGRGQRFRTRSENGLIVDGPSSGDGIPLDMHFCGYNSMCAVRAFICRAVGAARHVPNGLAETGLKR